MRASAWGAAATNPPPTYAAMQEALEPSVSAYKTFNSFFYRKLKPEVRPIAEPRDPCVVASAADCRWVAVVGLLCVELHQARPGCGGMEGSRRWLRARARAEVRTSQFSYRGCPM